MFIITWVFSMVFAIMFAITSWLIVGILTLFKGMSQRTAGRHISWMPKVLPESFTAATAVSQWNRMWYNRSVFLRGRKGIIA